jgi:hypothetical protein
MMLTPSSSTSPVSMAASHAASGCLRSRETLALPMPSFLATAVAPMPLPISSLILSASWAALRRQRQGNQKHWGADGDTTMPGGHDAETTLATRLIFRSFMAR